VADIELCIYVNDIAPTQFWNLATSARTLNLKKARFTGASGLGSGELRVVSEHW